MTTDCVVLWPRVVKGWEKTKRPLAVCGLSRILSKLVFCKLRGMLGIARTTALPTGFEGSVYDEKMCVCSFFRSPRGHPVEK